MCTKKCTFGSSYLVMCTLRLVKLNELTFLDAAIFKKKLFNIDLDGYSTRDDIL